MFGKSSSNAGTGVWGWADSATGETYGVSGLSDSDGGRGVYGETSSATGTTYGVYGRADSVDGYGGYFENAGGGVDIMAGGSGDVAQTADGDGLVKAAVYVFCDIDTPTAEIRRSFNNVPGAGPITISNVGGGCGIDFGFDLTNRYWSATLTNTGGATINCLRSPSPPSTLLCGAYGVILSQDLSYLATILVY